MSVTYALHDVVRSQNLSTYVSGADRSKYFKRPLIPIVQESSLTGFHLHQEESPIILKKDMVPVSRTRDAEVQTMYRESEAQTEPYTPSYAVKDGDSPEILTLEHLKWGKGLPATVEELQEIEIRREKHAFEWALPPTSDEASFHIRRELLKDQEIREWGNRETEIEDCMLTEIRRQQERLKTLMEALLQRETEVEEVNAQRIEEIKLKKTENKNRMVAKIQRRKIKVLRTLVKDKREEEDIKVEAKRDIIEEYHNFASRVYAGVAREGLSIDKLSNKYEVQPVLLASTEGLKELKMSMKPVYLETKINVGKFVQNIEGNYKKVDITHKKDLERAQALILRKKVRNGRRLDETNNSIEKTKFRAGTPEHVHEDYAHLKSHTERVSAHKAFIDRERALIIIQRLLRGRAIQNTMYEGKEKRLALVEELLAVANIKQKSDMEIQQDLLQVHENKLKEAVLESIQGEVMARTFDMLSKELVRFQQEKKINKLVNLAENDRRQREAVEGGKRQAETILLNRENLLYADIMKMHQTTVDHLLGNLMDNVVDKAASREASIVVGIKKSRLDEQLNQIENKSGQSSGLIKDLVASFLIPGIQRQKLQKKVAIEEKRFTHAAKSTLKAALTNESQTQGKGW